MEPIRRRVRERLILRQVVDSLAEFAAEYQANGKEIAVRYRRGYRMETWSYAEIGDNANRLARELESRGIGKGDAVLLWAENSPEWLIAYLGCVLRGAVVVPIDHASTAEFAGRIAQEVRARLVIGSHEALRAGLPVDAIGMALLIEQIAVRDGSPYKPPVLARQDTLEIIFTSGTTAEPRGVVISHGNVLANLEPIQKEIGKYLQYERFVHPLRFLTLLPLSHVFGQMMGIFIPPLLKGTVVFAGSPKPADLIQTIHQERVSALVAVPRFIEAIQRDIIRQWDANGDVEVFDRAMARAEQQYFLRRGWTFRAVHARFGWKFWAFISGGAALPRETERFWKRLGYAVIQGYGMTETTALISLNHPFRATEGSIGSTFPGVEVRVNERGEILVRGENVAKAYRSRDSLQATSSEDGWFSTGDIAERDESGKLFFRGRSRNVIVTPAGMNVYPEDVEQALRSQRGVKDCVVFGVDRGHNAEPFAVLLMESDASAASEAVKKANQALAEYQRVREWFVWPEPDFPRTPTLKPLLPRIRAVVSEPSGAAALRKGTSSEIGDLVRQITGRSLGWQSRDATLDADLGLTSLDRVELLGVLEQRYQVDLTQADFSDIRTLGQLEEALKRPDNLVNRTEYRYPRWPQSMVATFVRLAVYYLLAWPATYILAAPRVRGGGNLKNLQGPVLIACNHVTYLDIGWVLAALPARFRNRLAAAMGGERLARMRRPSEEVNVFQRLLQRLNYLLVSLLFNVYPLPQQAGFQKSFSFAGDLIDRRWNVLIFPEGRTTDDGTMAPFRLGIGLLAGQLNVPVVPIRLDGLAELKRKNRIWTWPGRVRVSIGPSVRFSARQSAEEITQELERRVAQLAW